MKGSPLPAILPLSALRAAARVRILYADIDAMGIVYHASYLRHLELARVELLRAGGLPYTHMRAAGLALPLTDVALEFVAPAIYDDLISIHAGVAMASRVRLAFHYRVTIEPGDRAGGPPQRIEVLRAQTRHCCVRTEGGRPERMPDDVWQLLRAQVAPDPADRV